MSNEAVPGWPLVSKLEFGALSSAVPCARLHTRFMLAEWNLSHVSEPAERIVSELMTNALQATWTYHTHTPVSISLLVNEKQLSIEVWDGVQQPPIQRAHAIDEEGGRGLEIISMLADSWGTYHPEIGGKTVYAVIIL